MRTTRRELLGALVALAPLAAACTAEGPAPIVGRKAPDLSLGALDGSRRSLADYTGRPLVLNFFATWCVPCRKELPAFQVVAQRYADRGLSILLVDMLEDPDDVAVFLAELGVDLPTVVDQTGDVGKTYRVRGLPSTFFIDRSGTIRGVQLGALDDSLLESGVGKIL